jgi:hypothetical protein
MGKFFSENKKWFGLAFLFVGAGLTAVGATEAAAAVAAVGAALGLSGITKSDAQAKSDNNYR